MAGPLALRFLCIENLARWARLGKLLGLWPEEHLNAQLQNIGLAEARKRSPACDTLCHQCVGLRP